MYWNILRKEKQTTETIINAMGRSNLSYKASMALIAASGGNTARFWTEHEGKKGVFQENAKDDKKYQYEKGGHHTREYMWKGALTRKQD